MPTWLTKIVPDLRDRGVRRRIGSAGELHGLLLDLVRPALGPEDVPNPRERAGMLFRVDHDHGGTQLLVQSRCDLDTGRLGPGFTVIGRRDLSPLLDRLEKGTLVRYRIAANPTRRLGRTDRERPQRTADGGPLSSGEHTTALYGAAADAWWERKAAEHGLEVDGFTAHGLQDARDRRNGRRVRHAVVRFDGVARVEDPDAVRTAVRAGVGRGKSFGCGLLSLAVVEPW